MDFKLHHGDCLEVLRSMADNSVDSIVTDPPYGLSFMGKRWDYDVPSVEVWAECLRVLKPGGHLLAFAGTRTQHRMAVRIEDAGFEIRDMIAWVYGSGFPKSLDVSKALDKMAGAEREVLCREAKDYHADRKTDHAGQFGTYMGKGDGSRFRDVTAPATDAARHWQGWGTALKPALEPITVARKPFIGTVAANVLTHGTGALNIDGCRVPLTGDADAAEFANNHAVTERLPQHYASKDLGLHEGGWKQRVGPAQVPEGRWPANVIHDGSDEVVALFPESASGAMKAGTKRAAQDEPGSVCYGVFGGNATSKDIKASSGSAARFFYCAKASRKDRNEGVGGSDAPAVANGATMREQEGADWSTRNGNHHPTVKPTDLMRYLCRLVTPPGGIVLDPFTGSGSTGKAAIREGFRFVGIERDADYLAIAEARIAFEVAKQAPQPAVEQPAKPQLDLFA